MARLRRRGGVDVQIAELAAKIEMLLRRQVLVAEEDDEILGQRAVDLVHLAVAGLAQVDAADLAANDRRQLVERDRFIRRVVGRVFDPGAAKAAQRALHSVSPSGGQSPKTRRKILSTCFR